MRRNRLALRASKLRASIKGPNNCTGMAVCRPTHVSRTKAMRPVRTTTVRSPFSRSAGPVLLAHRALVELAHAGPRQHVYKLHLEQHPVAGHAGGFDQPRRKIADIVLAHLADVLRLEGDPGQRALALEELLRSGSPFALVRAVELAEALLTTSVAVRAEDGTTSGGGQ